MPVDLHNLSIEDLKKIDQKTQERVCAIQTTSRKTKADCWYIEKRKSER